jgi:3-phenylpropionate/trans-cinnamate dioxygenase ferredoxin reductase subunit
LAVDAINQPKAFLLAKRFLSEGKTADPLKVVDETVDLKDVFFDPR